MPGGGVTKQGKWKPARNKGKFLFPVKAMSRVFRARFVAGLRKAFPEQPKAFFDQLFDKSWVIYAKRPFQPPKAVVEYLGRYTHKIAISNHRIVNLDNGQVTFSYKDYRKGAQKLQMSLPDQEFICTGNPAAVQPAYSAQRLGQNPALRFLIQWLES